jgi:hypothetical protein
MICHPKEKELLHATNSDDQSLMQTHKQFKRMECYPIMDPPENWRPDQKICQLQFFAL